MYQISAHLVYRDLRNATFEEKKCQPKLHFQTLLRIPRLQCRTLSGFEDRGPKVGRRSSKGKRGRDHFFPREITLSPDGKLVGQNKNRAVIVRGNWCSVWFGIGTAARWQYLGASIYDVRTEGGNQKVPQVQIIVQTVLSWRYLRIKWCVDSRTHRRRGETLAAAQQKSARFHGPFYP